MTLIAAITRYVTFRQSLGEHFDSAARILNTFCRQLDPEIDLRDIGAAHINAFLSGSGPVTRYWHNKHDALRGFYRYAVSRGWVAAAPLPSTLPQRPPRFVPYIYTIDELQRLVQATTTYRKHYRKMEPHTLRAILLLLYGAGLRVSEAVNLTLADVDLPNALITVHNTKFDKTRLVPLGADLHRVMAQYLSERQGAGHAQTGTAPFFVLRSGAQVSIQLLELHFRQLRAYAGVQRTDDARYQPRFHDLRHSFAVNRLTSWYRQGADVQALLPRLSTYLGHVSLAATQVYLTMTPELLQQASRRFERYVFGEGIDG